VGKWREMWKIKCWEIMKGKFVGKLAGNGRKMAGNVEDKMLGNNGGKMVGNG
jgi:hypothetical protein